jgi:hypothetical protein
MNAIVRITLTIITGVSASGGTVPFTDSHRFISFTEAYCQDKQEYKDYLLKKVGNLYILNVGAQDGVKEYTVYNLYFEEPKRIPLIRLKIKSVRSLFGAVEVTQVFPDYCVVRVISRVMEKEPSGNRIILERKALPDTLLSQYLSPYAVPVKPEQIKEIPKTIVKTIKSDIRDAGYNPFSFGISYFTGYDEIPKPIGDNVAARLNRDVYSGNGLSKTKLTSSNGAAMSVSKGLTHFFALQGDVASVKHSSEVATHRNPAELPPIGTVSVNSWDFDITTTVTAWSLSLQVSQFSNATAPLAKLPRKHRFVPRFGAGFDYATVSVKMKESVELTKYTGNESRALSEKQSMGGYRGMHTTAGLDMYMNVYKFYVEWNYTYWFTDKFNSSNPFRFGVSIFF